MHSVQHMSILPKDTYDVAYEGGWFGFNATQHAGRNEGQVRRCRSTPHMVGQSSVYGKTLKYTVKGKASDLTHSCLLVDSDEK